MSEEKNNNFEKDLLNDLLNNISDKSEAFESEESINESNHSENVC